MGAIRDKDCCDPKFYKLVLKIALTFTLALIVSKTPMLCIFILDTLYIKNGSSIKKINSQKLCANLDLITFRNSPLYINIE